MPVNNDAPEVTIRTFYNLCTRVFIGGSDPPFLNDVFPGLTNHPYSDAHTSKDTDIKLQLHACEISIRAKRRRKGFKVVVRTPERQVFYGTGMNFRKFPITGGRYCIENRDSPHIIQRWASYSNIPFVISSTGWGMFILDAGPLRFSFSSDGVRVRGMRRFDMLFFDGSIGAVIERYTRISGRPPLFPKWAFGLWNTSYPAVDQNATLDFIREFRKRHIPLDTVILDYHWEERFHNFQWNPRLFPEPERFIESAKREGVTLGLITTPFVNSGENLIFRLFARLIAGPNFPVGMSQLTKFADHSLYAEGKSHSAYAHDNAPWWFGRGGMIDFTSPDAVAFWNRLTNRLLAAGIRFFKNDDGEYLPSDGVTSAAGLSTPEYRNLYGFYYGKAVHENNETFTGQRGICYARCVWAGSQRYPAVFLGDQKACERGIARSLYAGLSMSIIGFAYWTADLYGLSGRVSPAMHRRYMQYAIFSPVARHFSSPFDHTRDPWHYGAAHETLFRSYVKLRYRLLPHYYSCAYRASADGTPIVRPLVLEYPEDPAAAVTGSQFMLGREIMICPLYGSEATLYLPAGNWRHPRTLRKIEGDRRIDARPWRSGDIPLFIRDGSIIPTVDVMMHIPERVYFTKIYLNIFPGQPCTYRLYDDYGEGTGCRKGEFSLTGVSCEHNGSDMTIRIEHLEGRIIEPRRFVVRIFCVRDFDEVTASLPVTSWHHESRNILTATIDTDLAERAAIRIRGIELTQ